VGRKTVATVEPVATREPVECGTKSALVCATKPTVFVSLTRLVPKNVPIAARASTDAVMGDRPIFTAYIHSVIEARRTCSICGGVDWLYRAAITAEERARGE
jgi:hypothetical protein